MSPHRHKKYYNDTEGKIQEIFWIRRQRSFFGQSGLSFFVARAYEWQVNATKFKVLGDSVAFLASAKLIWPRRAKFFSRQSSSMAGLRYQI
jgi:hypothetical protein